MCYRGHEACVPGEVLMGADVSAAVGKVSVLKIQLLVHRTAEQCSILLLTHSPLSEIPLLTDTCRVFPNGG